ncbi:MAG TPA: hypothetical protein VF145_00305, partial [Chitinophagaceae bacterium]
NACFYLWKQPGVANRDGIDRSRKKWPGIARELKRGFKWCSTHYIRVFYLKGFCSIFVISQLMEVNKNTQLHYLERKYKELTDQYLFELNEGRSLSTIKDMSFVLATLKKEIEMLQRETAALPQAKNTDTASI